MIHLPYQAISTRSAANELSWLSLPGRRNEREKLGSAALPPQHSTEGGGWQLGEGCERQGLQDHPQKKDAPGVQGGIPRKSLHFPARAGF